MSMKDKILLCSTVVRARIQTLREELGYRDISNNALANEARLEDRSDYVDLSVELGNLLIVQPLIIRFATNGGENMSLENQNLVNILLNRYAHQTLPAIGEINETTTTDSIASEMSETNNSTQESNGIFQFIYSFARFFSAVVFAFISLPSTSASQEYNYMGGVDFFDPNDMSGKFHYYPE